MILFPVFVLQFLANELLNIVLNDISFDVDIILELHTKQGLNQITDNLF